MECRHQADRGARNAIDSVPVACAPPSSLGPDWSPSELKPGACSGPGPVSTRGDRACFSGIYLRDPLTPGLGLELASALQAPGPQNFPFSLLPLSALSGSGSSLAPRVHLPEMSWAPHFPSKVSLHFPSGFCLHLLFQQNSGVYQPHWFFWVVLARSWRKQGK